MSELCNIPVVDVRALYKSPFELNVKYFFFFAESVFLQSQS